MADVRYDLVLGGDAADALRDAAAAAKQSADAHDEATRASRQASDAAKAQAQAEREAAQAASDASEASRRLRDIVLSVASVEERATAIHAARADEIRRLAAVAGDAALGERALAANTEVMSRALAEAQARTQGAREELARLGASGDAMAGLQLRLDGTIRRIRELERQTGDSVGAERAIAAAQRDHAAAVGRLNAATTPAGRSMAGFGSALGSIGQQMPDVIAQLQAGADPMLVLTQQGGQVASSLMATGGGAAGLMSALGALIPIVVAAGAAVAAVALAFSAWSGDLSANQAALDNLSASTALTKEAIAALKPIVDDTRLTLRALAVETGKLSEEQGRLAAAAEDAFGRWNRATDSQVAKLAELRREQSSTWTQVVDGVRAGIEEFDELAGIDPTADLAVFDYLFTTGAEIGQQIDVVSDALDRSVGVLGENRKAHQELVKVQAEKEGRDKSGAAATRAATQADTARAAALRALRAAYTDSLQGAASLLGGPLTERDQLAAAADELYTLASASDVSTKQAAELSAMLERVVARIAEIDAAAASVTLDTSEAERQIAALQAQIDSLSQRRGLTLTAALQVIGSFGGSGRGLQALGNQMVEGAFGRAVAGTAGSLAPLAGGIGAGLAGAGAIGGAAVAAVRVAGGLDEMEAGIKETTDAALKNLTRLDELLPGILAALREAVVDILANLPEIVAGLVVGILRGLVQLGQSILDGLGELGRRIVAALLPGRQAGEPDMSRGEKANVGIGAIAGGVLGFALGGPVGAAAGAAIGAAAGEAMNRAIEKGADFFSRSAPQPQISLRALSGGAVGPVATGGGQAAPVVMAGPSVSVNVHARPMVALDRQSGRMLATAIRTTTAKQIQTVAPPGRRMS